MNIQEYISSGILEQYVLGQLSTEEEGDVRDMADRHPEIKAEINRIEIDLEQFSRLHSVSPPGGTLTAILNQISSETPKSPPSSGGSPGRNWTPWMLLGLMALLFVWQFIGNRNEQKENQELQQALIELREDCAREDSTRQILASQLEIYRDPDYQLVTLTGTDLAATALATVFYNPEESQTYFDPVDLPPTPPGKQYQLWALVDGQPIDMGVLALDLSQELLTSVPFVPNAGAFAITLEEEGGRPTPDLTQLYVIGEVAT